MNINEKMNIQIVKKEEKNEILNIWKKEREYLGIPFNKFIDDIIENQRLFCIKNNDKIICFGGFEIMKRKKEIRLTKLCTVVEYRRKGLQKKIVSYIMSKTKHIGFDYIVHCKKGAINNYFYQKYGQLESEYSSKTMIIRVYKLFPEKFGVNDHKKQLNIFDI